MTPFWSRVAKQLSRADEDPELRAHLDEGQRRSLRFIAKGLPRHGLVLADEVGTGKTRIACVLVDAVLRSGGRAAVVVPRGLLGQWRDEFRVIRKDCDPRELTTWLGFLEQGSGQRTSGEWWLLSHGFRFPSLQANSPAWKFALPWLVRLAGSEKERLDGRTRLGRLWQQVDLSKTRWNGQWAIANEMAKRLPGALRSSLGQLELPDWETHDNAALTSLFSRKDRGPGLLAVDALMGRWIGRLDLVIVDEAHKSRDVEVDGKPRTILSELLEYVLDTDGDTRRFCVTATPMELAVEQWAPLLHRARADVDTPKLERAVEGLKLAVRSAGEAPDEELRIVALEAAAGRFQGALGPFVTRRRRREEGLQARFRASLAENDVPHPHRNVERVPIRWETEVKAAGPEWRRLLIALEGIARSARGLSDDQLGGSIKTLHTKLASGHVSLDLLDEERLSTLFAGSSGAHENRFLYWCREYERARSEQRQAARTLGLAGFDPDAEHPRILAAVTEIERWIAPESGGLGEKVLCFGVFLRPLRLLRDVLNVRHALRSLDRGEPVSASVESLRAVTYRNYERMLAAGQFRQRLLGALLKPKSLMKKMHRAHEDHANERRRIGGRIDRELAVELRRRGIDLERHVLESLQRGLHMVALEARRAGDSEAEWKQVLQQVLDENEDGSQAGAHDDADADPDSRLRSWIEGEHGEDADSRVPSGFCRLLQGSSEWVTRRTLQASFNRSGRLPTVLLAQSAVGREGLNLHKACRVVIQLHAEWNPAIIEQQIGRVDRKGSLWEVRAEEWLRQDEATRAAPPKVEVRQIVFDGTYDAKQWERVGKRQHLFDAALFGSLLPMEAWLRASEDHRRRLEKAAPNFSPPHLEVE